MKALFRLLLCAPLLSGCQSSSTVDDLLAGRKIDYQKDIEQEQRELQYPPDLIANGTDVEGTVSLSEYAIRSLPKTAEREEGEFQPVDVAYRRDGRVRWVAAKQSPAKLWPQVLDFWKDDVGFPVSKENEQSGVMETSWLDLRRDEAAAPGVSSYLDGILNVVRDSGNRDKFITRLELGNAEETDIYISHRHIVGRFEEETGSFLGYEPASNQVELEIEMMRRLILYLTKRGDEQAAAEDAAVAEQIAEAEVDGATGDYEILETELIINRPFLDAWRLVQIALDRGGFTIEDRDYESGVVYIRHSGGPESDQIFGEQNEGFFAKLFGEETGKVRDLQLSLIKADGDAITRITVDAAEDDEPLTDEQRSIVLNLLYERLP